MIVIISDRLGYDKSFPQHRGDHLFRTVFAAASGNSDCLESKLSSVHTSKSLQRSESIRHYDLGKPIEMDIQVAHQGTGCRRLFNCRQESVPVKLFATKGHKKFARPNQPRIGDHFRHFAGAESVELAAHERCDLFKCPRIHALTTPPGVPSMPDWLFH